MQYERETLQQHSVDGGGGYRVNPPPRETFLRACSGANPALAEINTKPVSAYSGLFRRA